MLHIADCTEDASYRQGDADFVEFVDLCGARTNLAAPMLKDNRVDRRHNHLSQEVRPFTDKQIALLQNFASQAVIAIENARLLNDLRERTTDLTAALEQQTATSDVLGIISNSPGHLQPVFDVMLANATRLCGASYGTMWLHENEGQMRMAARYGPLPEAFSEKWRVGKLFSPSLSVPTARVFDTRRPVQVRDLKEDRSYSDGDPLAVASVNVAGIRSLIAVPMLKENTIVGALTIYRQEVRPFTDKQIELVTNFAAQAVIAIENARLLNELRQSLEQQTATSQVLQVISSSPGDLRLVFATMLENATRICEAKFGALYLSDGDGFRATAMHNAPPAYEEARAGVLHPPASTSLWRAANTKQAVQIADVRLERGYVERDPFVVSAVALGGYRSVLSVPLLHEDELVGVITIFRQEVRPFTDEQISLVQNFAAQAVIAIENARLLSELRQSLEQQTATANVLEVISRSAFDLRAVFETVAESSVRLCGADRAFIFQFDGELLRMAASYNATPEFAEWVNEHPIRPGIHSGSARAALERRTIHIPDVRVDPDYVYGAKDVETIRTVLGEPILKGDELLGVMMIYHLEVRPFTDKQIALVETFADQAAIGIENVRLFEAEQQRSHENARLLQELRESTQEVVKLNQQLEQRVTDQVGEIERMGRLRRFLPPQVADLIVASGDREAT